MLDFDIEMEHPTIFESYYDECDCEEGECSCNCETDDEEPFLENEEID